jgi:hypothetical protein
MYLPTGCVCPYTVALWVEDGGLVDMAGANEAARGGLVIDFVVPSAVEAKLVGLPLVNISYIGQSKYVHLENVHHLRSYLAKT